MKPVGSGWFAAVCGGFAVLLSVGTFHVTIAQLDADWLLRGWLWFVAACLLAWGVNRVVKGDKRDLTIGQDTITFVVGLAAVTVSIVALVKGH
jgi:hypothetical protein